MYAIINRKTRKWVYGTDFSVYPRRQRTSYDNCLIFGSRGSAEIEFLTRQCGKDYKIVPVRVEELVD